ncbi:DUF3016 domain-containing protein [Massilia sp. UMI-21]|nr:DUF3016 domain-containing protein [Massilia sp. UMI-21]
MKSSMCKAVLAAICVLGAGAASAGMSVNYVNPEKFSDLPTSDWERENVLRDLVKFFDKLAQDLPAGQDLTVNITDIDLAGREYPGQRATGDMRVREGKSDWPYVEIHYTLSANGQVIDNGVAQLRDQSYLLRPTKLSMENDSLRYEKRMIQDWFKKTILKK